MRVSTGCLIYVSDGFLPPFQSIGFGLFKGSVNMFLKITEVWEAQKRVFVIHGQRLTDLKQFITSSSQDQTSKKNFMVLVKVDQDT